MSVRTPHPRDAVTRIPARLGPGCGGSRYSHVTPGCPAPPYGPFAISHRAQRCLSPRAAAPPQPAHGHDGWATRRAFCLASSDRRATSQTGHSRWAACLTGPARLPALLPSPGTAHPLAAQLNTPPSPQLPPTCGHLACPPGPPPPAASPPHCCPQGPRPGLVAPAWLSVIQRFCSRGAPILGGGSGTTLVRVLMPAPFTVAAIA